MTAWLFSSSLTIARQASDDSTSVGRKCLRANVLLPEPLGPIRTTRQSLGIVIFMVVRGGNGLVTSISSSGAVTASRTADKGLVTRGG